MSQNPFESGTSSQTLEQVNDVLIAHERACETGPYLRTLITYISLGKYQAAAAHTLCLSLGERMRSEHERGESEDARAMRALGEALVAIGKREEGLEPLVAALEEEALRHGVREQEWLAKRLGRQNA